MNEQTSDLRDEVHRHYATVATAVRTGARVSCCGVDTSGAVSEVEIGDGFGGRLYAAADRDALPARAVTTSLGTSRYPTAPST
ncbi:MAG: hypothetical protein ACRDSR_22010 [Pseudonocardiaceae bacterium]